ncbi:MAG: proline--tRNA ligase [Phycisphaerales bacterium]
MTTTRTIRGSIQRWSRTLIPTSKEAPAEAQAISHKLLVRAGYIRQVGAGIYDYLPLAFRTLQKISTIVREEMEAAGASEMLMPALEPFELFEGTKRDVDYGDNLFRLIDRHDRKNALAPTHEEVITECMRGSVSSYSALPLNLFQIQTKFRDEFRPRSGLLRCREFIMKDAYSFHMNVEGPGGLNDAYDAMHRAYTNIFTRCGLSFTVVEAESGPIGGSASHEFMVNAESGEDTILSCPTTGYAANVEKCEIGPRPHTFDAEPTGELTKVHTPNLPGIDDVGKFMKVKPDRMLKTLVFAPADPKVAGVDFVLVTLRGDHEANEGKIKAAAGFPVAMADEKAARAAGFAIGYVSPRAASANSKTLLIIDPDAAQSGFWATGADEADHHVKHFNWKRDLGLDFLNSPRVKVADIRNALPGDPSPRDPNAKLIAKKGIEVGHIFKLGTKYSEAMDFRILDADQQRRAVIMGCYGIGVSRTMAACVEMSSDDNGIVWPAAIAPYHVLIVPMKVDADSPHMRAALDLAQQLSAAGLDVLIDDRDERPGVKFKDADLIGLPVRLTLGDKALEASAVEFKRRNDTTTKGELVPIANAVQHCLNALA